MIAYIPRAIQVALFSPFPSSWFAEHPSQLSKLMHIVTGLEMMIVYICLAGLVVSMHLWRRKIEFWIMISFSFYFALIPTYAFPNIGALMRYRYGAIMLLVALGVSAFLYLYNHKGKIK